MKNVIFIAPPAAGKGTQSAILESLGYEHISSGNMLRGEINKETPLGIKIKESISKGELIKDEDIFELIRKRIISLDKPFILDGFPRNIDQAIILDKLFQELNIQNYEVIYLNIDLEEALKRALGRLTCICGATYNLHYEKTKPQKENICDKCGRMLEIRDDDNRKSIEKRFETFIASEKELKKYYLEKNKLHIIDVSIGMNKVADKIKEILK